MTDIYLSFVPADRPVAAGLAAAAEERGWSVVWDDADEDAAEAALTDAGCVIAIWSNAAAGPDGWVGSEAAEAARRSALIVAQSEAVRLPRRLRKAPAVDLTGWDGAGRPPGLATVMERASEMLASASRAGPAPTPPPLTSDRATRVPRDLFEGRVGELRGHHGEVYDLAWSPNGLLVATASADGTARIWDAAHLEELRRLEGHEGEVNDVSFSPDGSMIASAGDDGTVRLWDARSSTPRGEYRGHEDIVFWAAFSPAGDVIASAGSDGKVDVWRVSDGGRVWNFDLEEEVSTARFLDSTVLVTADDDGDLVLWDLETGDPIVEMDAHEGQIADIAVSPTGALLASGSSSAELAVFNVIDGSLRWWGSDMAGQVYGLAFSTDGRLLAASDDDGVTLFDADDGDVVDGRADPGATRLEFSPTGPALALASGDVVRVVAAAS